MHLEFSDDQLELRESTRAALSRECSPQHVHDVVATGVGAAELSKLFAWRGWTAFPIGVDQGGLGRGEVELAVILEEMGRAATPGPFLPTVAFYVPTVREAGTHPQTHRFLAAVASGQTTGTVALHERDSTDPLEIAATARRDGDGWVLAGRKTHVVCATQVDEVIIPAQHDAGLGLFVVPTAELTFHERTSIDPTRPVADVDLDGVWVPDARLLGPTDGDATSALRWAIVEAAIGCTLDAVGACSALVDATVTSASAGSLDDGSEPSPDGIQARRIASSHRQILAGMVVELELARAATYHAVAAIDAGAADLDLITATAAAVTASAQSVITAGALELGPPDGQFDPDVTDPGKIDIDLWCRRAFASTMLTATPASHRSTMARHLLHQSETPAVAPG